MVEKIKPNAMFLLSPNDIFEEFGDIALDQYGFPSYYFEVSLKELSTKNHQLIRLTSFGMLMALI